MKDIVVYALIDNAESGTEEKRCYILDKVRVLKSITHNVIVDKYVVEIQEDDSENNYITLINPDDITGIPRVVYGD